MKKLFWFFLIGTLSFFMGCDQLSELSDDYSIAIEDTAESIARSYSMDSTDEIAVMDDVVESAARGLMPGLHKKEHKDDTDLEYFIQCQLFGLFIKPGKRIRVTANLGLVSVEPKSHFVF